MTLFNDLALRKISRHEVVEAYLWLIPINASKFSPAFRKDLEQEGVIALYRAVDLFDTSRGLRFSTYAVHWLRQSFLTWIYNHSSTVRIPTYMRKVMNRVSRGGDLEDVNDSTMAWARKLNEQSTVTADDLEFEDRTEPAGHPPRELASEIEQALAALSPRERRLVRKRYWKGLTLREIGEQEGVSLERVRQVINRALKRMKSPVLSELL